MSSLRFDFLLFPLEISRRSNYPSAVAKLREQNQHEERNAKLNVDNPRLIGSIKGVQTSIHT